ncbi:MAG: 2-oxoglutarate dehydrogenase E1 component [Gemmatimonadales bacterium]|jgi:2-oxoglutarate dehydrogenase E1 component
MSESHQADGYNAGYADQLVERRLRDRGIVPPSLLDADLNGGSAEAVLAQIAAPTEAAAAPVSTHLLHTAMAAGALAEDFRTHGHLLVPVDPLGSEPPGHPSLTLEFHGVTEADLAQVPAAAIGLERLGRTALDVVESLRAIYCGRIGYELDHMDDVEQWNWLVEYIESGRHLEPMVPEMKIRVLEVLTEVEGFEHFLHRAFLGQKRFSIEGLDMMIPMLGRAARLAAEGGAKKIFLGMAHRGRLAVLSRLVGRPYESIIADFEGEHEQGLQTTVPGSGDVKYHLGARQMVETSAGEIEAVLAPNPSHLEHVNPVVEGMARAAREHLVQEGAPTGNGNAIRFDEEHGTGVLPVLIHGDAAFIGQGVVAETLNLCRLRGYETGGTLHIVANNQLGFTTDPNDGRSTRYASDLALAFRVPILHVNADDPEACLAAIQLGMDYRTAFGQDIVIDLVGYRRYGHNEGDEPSYTQPDMYELIDDHPTVRDLWVDRLVADGTIERSAAEKMADEFDEQMQAARRQVTEQLAATEEEDGETSRTSIMELGPTKLADPAEVVTAVSRDELERINEALHTWPADFHVFPKLGRQLERRKSQIDAGFDWAHGEALAFGSLLEVGVPIRLSGEDTQRGTFSQRHAVLHDVETGGEYIPLANLSREQASFQVWNSPLSEVACLGFEYGYSVFSPDALVLWEAQFGDFANVGQAIIDQFIVSGRSKWGLESRLVLLLPHGYEGQGPEHSSARLERFLNLGAEGNIRVANCTTPAQYFHLLRLQALRADRRPLVVMSPKSLLRHPAARSTLSELTEGAFHPVLPGARDVGAEAVTRLVLCSGKVYYDLVGSEAWESADSVDVARIELLYPFPTAELRGLLDGYPALEEVVWLQEEPENMGAWRYLRARLAELTGEGRELRLVARPERASPAAGTATAHGREQQELIEEALSR